MATEDHDFEEIFFHLKGKNKMDRKQRCSGAFIPRSTGTFIDAFWTEYRRYPKRTQIKDWIQHSYRSAQNLAEATLRLVHQLFADYGLVILDADQRALKSNFIPI